MKDKIRNEAILQKISISEFLRRTIYNELTKKKINFLDQ